MAEISIIVPFFNCGKYLTECIEGVVKQSFLGWELLLVDDGSTDNGHEICKEYCCKDGRIAYLHQSHRGVSSARNLGLYRAAGRYVIFLDADDYWTDADALQSLYNEAERTSSDIVRGEYHAVSEDGAFLFKSRKEDGRSSLSSREIDASVFFERILAGEYFLVLNLIRRNLIGDLRFDESMSFLEDCDFLCRVLARCAKCHYIQLDFYAYRKRQTSASYNGKVSNLSDSFKVGDNLMSFQGIPTPLSLVYRKAGVRIVAGTIAWFSSSPFYSERAWLVEELHVERTRLQTKMVLKEQTDFNLANFPELFLPSSVSPVVLHYYHAIREFLYRIYCRLRQA